MQITIFFKKKTWISSCLSTFIMYHFVWSRHGQTYRSNIRYHNIQYANVYLYVSYTSEIATYHSYYGYCASVVIIVQMCNLTITRVDLYCSNCQSPFLRKFMDESPTGDGLNRLNHWWLQDFCGFPLRSPLMIPLSSITPIKHETYSHWWLHHVMPPFKPQWYPNMSW